MLTEHDPRAEVIGQLRATFGLRGVSLLRRDAVSGWRAEVGTGDEPPDQPDHPWSGFTQFKRSFGGMLLTRAGTWDLPVRPWLYRTWSAAQRLRR